MTTQEFNTQVNKFTDFIQNLTKSMFEQNKEVKASAFALTAPDKETPDKFNVASLVLPHQLFDTEEGKSLVADAIRANNDDLKPMAIAVIVEGYGVKMDKTDANLDAIKKGEITPSERDDKIELVMVSVETYAANGMGLFEIKRDSEEPTLELMDKFEWIPKSDEYPVGRLQNLISKCYVELETGASA